MDDTATIGNDGEHLLATTTIPLTQNMRTRQCREAVRMGNGYTAVGVKYVRRQSPVTGTHHPIIEDKVTTYVLAPNLLSNTI